MTPDAFIRTWSCNPLSERASAQSHFRDLCALLGVDPPSPLTAGTLEFEKGRGQGTTGGDGWADVWMKDAFAWEYKKTKANKPVGQDPPGAADPPPFPYQAPIAEEPADDLRLGEAGEVGLGFCPGPVLRDLAGVDDPDELLTRTGGLRD